jgi:hypothetical protein
VGALNGAIVAAHPGTAASWPDHVWSKAWNKVISVASWPPCSTPSSEAKPDQTISRSLPLPTASSDST